MKGLELIGLPVYDLQTGKKISKVTDLWLNESWEITHLVLERRSFYSRSTPVIAWEYVTACGEDAVMLSDREQIQEMKNNEAEQHRTFLQGSQRIKELPILTPEGSQLGWVADVYFQPQLGNTIVGMEITDGLLSDLIEGRVLYEGTGHMGAHAIIVSEAIN